MALSTITGENKKTIICTGSLAAILSIDNIFTQNCLAQQIHDSYQQLVAKNNTVTIVWTPSHVGIPGNERADKAAKEALNMDLPTVQIQLHTDLQNSLKQSITSKWQHIWSLSNAKLAQIQTQITAHNLPLMPRKDTIIIHRLRIGHTGVTHGHILDSLDPPRCECNDILTVNHILSECPKYDENRLKWRIGTDLKEDLATPENIARVINFLKDIKLYNCI
ncbi:uncharacterized protein LOC116165707 [Photinus pyralis]|uniref:uncharacterized protein LOC116165707 n=1 Tax=Photinus pyralis TaxID=7054 RepID=UPI0012678223|nr:uncharacterized protein LOC116165707 [Photinus pyralis]